MTNPIRLIVQKLNPSKLNLQCRLLFSFCFSLLSDSTITRCFKKSKQFVIKISNIFRAYIKQGVIVLFMDKKAEQIANDVELIKELGGATKVARLLGWDDARDVTRVQNWLKRGIPPNIKLEYPKIFLKNLKK